MRQSVLVGLVTLLLLLMPCAAPAQGASGTITGIVTAQAGSPMAGASVSIPALGLGSRTDASGRYTFARVPTGTHQLRASLIGFTEATRSVTVVAGQTATANVQLQQAALELEGVVAVGYGSQRRQDVTGSVASVDAVALEKSPSVSVSQTLQGRVAGVQVTQNSSAPGGGFSIRIRGSGSLSSSNEPLYVVDGFPVTPSEPRTEGILAGSNSTAPSALSFLNPDDIESIEVLKDASATAIYGSRGANGVVLVTTKKGRAGSTLMEVESSYGVQKLSNRYDLLNAEQYASYINDMYRMQDRAGEAPYPDPSVFGTGTDWQEVILRAAPVMQHNVLVRGSAGATQFSVSGAFSDQQGIVKETDFRRYSFRGTIGHSVTPRLTLGSNISVTRTRTNGGGAAADGTPGDQSSAMQAALITWPFLPVYDEKGKYTYMDQQVSNAMLGLNFSPGHAYDNPLALVLEPVDEFQDNRVLGNLSAELKVMDGLNLRVMGGADILHNSRNAYFPRTTRIGAATSGRATSGTVERTNYLAESILTYTRKFAESHNLTAVSGFTYESSSDFVRSLGSSGFSTDHLSYYGLDTGTQAGGPFVGVASGASNLTSFLGRVNYGFADKYLLTLTGRYDGSSKFGAGNKWGFFPSAALGWRVVEEPFFRDIGWLSDLKLRLSYGVAGNQEIGRYQSLARMGTGAVVWGGQRVIGYYPSSIANDDLRWERSRMGNVGFDLGLMDNRLTAYFDMYRKVTDDLLFSVPLPLETGFGSALQNSGSIQNTGAELALLATLVEEADFAWRLGGNIATNRNEVLSIGGDTKEFFGSFLGVATDANSGLGNTGNLVRVGEPIGVFFGYDYDGIFRTKADVDAHVGANGKPIQPGALVGQVRYRDLNGDGTITAADQTILGNPEPDFFFGIINDFRFGPLNLHTFLQGSQGGAVYNYMLAKMAPERGGLNTNYLVERVANSWTPETPNAKWPRVSIPEGLGYRGLGNMKEVYIEDGSFLRLKTVSLSYDVPQRLIAGLRSSQIYVNAENLHTWQRYSGMNPDVNSQGGNNINRGIDQGGYPPARTYRVGVKVGL